jgi:ADP-ribose pyrophosphatase YjhB (NUDIX family)
MQLVAHLNPKRLDPDFIPQALYDQIIELLPIVSVEAVIEISGGLLYLKRRNPPAKGLWWFPGGRIHKCESLMDALHREIWEETGLQITSAKLLNVYSRVFDERHDITVAYRCTVKKAEISLNDEHSEWGVFKNAPCELHPYMAEIVKDAESAKLKK